jgi:hypothetical protein
MKNVLLILLVFSVFALNAQDYNKWSAGLNLGSHDGMRPTTSFTKAYQIDHYNGHIRHMSNNRFGWKIDMAFDRFDFKNESPSTNLMRFQFNRLLT